MEEPKFMVSIVTDTTEIEDWLVEHEFEFQGTGAGSFEFVTDKDIDMNELAQKLASMLIRVPDLRE
jgi:hypothetical protein